MAGSSLQSRVRSKHQPDGFVCACVCRWVHGCLCLSVCAVRVHVGMRAAQFVCVSAIQRMYRVVGRHGCPCVLGPHCRQLLHSRD